MTLPLRPEFRSERVSLNQTSDLIRMFGVSEFLETELGWNKYSNRTTLLPRRRKIYLSAPSGGVVDINIPFSPVPGSTLVPAVNRGEWLGNRSETGSLFDIPAGDIEIEGEFGWGHYILIGDLDGAYSADATGLPSIDGVEDPEWKIGNIIRINDELIYVDRETGGDPDRVMRGADETEVAEHEDGSTVYIVSPTPLLSVAIDQILAQTTPWYVYRNTDSVLDPAAKDMVMAFAPPTVSGIEI